ncbi:MAG: response regulator transcription factor, partial [Dehalococcoidia bacterium]|nr:response regulator transcription factor [Dehalococcoidia bacterium]
DYASIIEYTLKRGGHEVVVALSSAAALGFCRRKRPELALLDIRLPDGSGYELCKTLRKANPELPVLFLSSLDSPASVVEGLQQGGDDYVTKPFHPSELLARVAAVTRRTGRASTGSAEAAPTIEASGFVVDLDAATARFLGQDIPCTPTEIEILAELLTYPGEVLSYQFLTNKIWGYSNVHDSTMLKGHVSALRRKLREAGVPEHLVQTVHNVGYTFMPEMDGE